MHAISGFICAELDLYCLLCCCLPFLSQSPAPQAPPSSLDLRSVPYSTGTFAGSSSINPSLQLPFAAAPSNAAAVNAPVFAQLPVAGGAAFASPAPGIATTHSLQHVRVASGAAGVSAAVSGDNSWAARALAAANSISAPHNLQLQPVQAPQPAVQQLGAGAAVGDAAARLLLEYIVRQHGGDPAAAIESIIAGMRKPAAPAAGLVQHPQAVAVNGMMPGSAPMPQLQHAAVAAVNDTVSGPGTSAAAVHSNSTGSAQV